MKRLIFFLVVAFFFQSAYCQKKFTLSGFITDANNGETLIGATVYSKSVGQGVISNNYGFYSLTLPEGDYEISFSFIARLSIFLVSLAVYSFISSLGFVLENYISTIDTLLI